MEFKKYKLRDLGTVDISGVDKKSYEGEKPVRLCNFTDVYKNWAITKYHYPTLMKATAKDRDIEKFKIRKGQVAITKDSETRDDIGIPTYIADDFDDVVLGYHCALITPGDALDGQYLNAYLNSKMAKKYFEGYASGSGQRYTLTLDSINDFQIWLPEIKTQKRISKILSDIDRKIALNTRMNAELEAMAKQLYDYWFVQFDFPNENGNPYKSSGGKMVYNPTLKREIPAGWEVNTINNIIEPIERGISYSSEDIKNQTGIPMVNLACYSKQGEYRPGELKVYSGNYKSENITYPYDMLIACTDMTQDADIIGRPILVTEEYKSYVYSMDLIKITSRDIDKFYLYYSLRTPFYHKYIKPFASGTNVKHLKVDGITNYSISIPPSGLQFLFGDFIYNLKKREMKVINENKNLTHLRDSLLPMLMNGQVTI